MYFYIILDPREKKKGGLLKKKGNEARLYINQFI